MSQKLDNIYLPSLGGKNNETFPFSFTVGWLRVIDIVVVHQTSYMELSTLSVRIRNLNQTEAFVCQVKELSVPTSKKWIGRIPPLISEDV